MKIKFNHKHFKLYILSPQIYEYELFKTRRISFFFKNLYFLSIFTVFAILYITRWRD